VDEDTLSKTLRSLRTKPGARSWRCPDEITIAAFAEGRLGDTERERVEAHLAGCDACLDLVAFLARRAAESAPEVPERLVERAQALVPARPPWLVGWGWRWAAATAAIAGVVLVVTLQLRQPEFDLAPPQAPSAPEIQSREPAAKSPEPAAPTTRVKRPAASRIPSPEIISPREGAVLRHREPEFRWQAVSGAAFYEIRLVTEEGNLVWQEQTENTHAQLPALVPLSGGGKYFVWVHAHMPGGRVVKSGVVSFRAS